MGAGGVKNTALEFAISRGFVRHPETRILVSYGWNRCPFCGSGACVLMPATRADHLPTASCLRCDSIAMQAEISGKTGPVPVWDWISPRWESRPCI